MSTPKFYLVLTATCLSTLFTACKKDDTNTTTNQASIVGTFSLNSQGSDRNMNNIVDVGEEVLIPNGYSLTEVFRADGTGSESETNPGNAATVRTFTYALSADNTLTLNFTGSTENKKILKLETLNMVWYDVSTNPHFIRGFVRL